MGTAACCGSVAVEPPSAQEQRRERLRGANRVPLAASFMAGTAKPGLSRNTSAKSLSQGPARPSRSVQNDLAKATYSDFTQCSTLGTGAFGCVKLCRHRVNGETCAMKITHKNHCETAAKDGKKYESAAIGLLTKIDHPFIIRTYRTFWEGDQVCTLMEVGDGGVFSDHIKNGGLQESAAKFYAAEMALAIGRLHEIGIVFHDFKPDNLLLSSIGHIKLIDFGLAAFNEQKSKRVWCKCHCGTPSYMAPELILNQLHDGAVDWWALGVVVYEMLRGRVPFEGRKTGALVNQICAAKVDFGAIRQLSSEGKSFCEGLLTVDESSRLGSTNDVKEIKGHKWFSSIDWSKLLAGRLPPPIVPGVVLDAGGGFSGAMFAAAGGNVDVAKQQNTATLKKKSLSGENPLDFRSRHH